MTHDHQYNYLLLAYKLFQPLQQLLAEIIFYTLIPPLLNIKLSLSEHQGEFYFFYLLKTSLGINNLFHLSWVLLYQTKNVGNKIL